MIFTQLLLGRVLRLTSLVTVGLDERTKFISKIPWGGRLLEAVVSK